MPKNRKALRRIAGILLVVILILVVDQIWLRVWRIVPAGYDTTRLTRPQEKDGQVNYLAAMNQQSSIGVTRANNAVPLLIKAAGPQFFPLTLHAIPIIMSRLGMRPFGPHSAGLIRFSNWTNRQPTGGKAASESQNWALETRLQMRPWTGHAYPNARGWIKANNRALTLIFRAAKRPRYYIPLVSPDGGLVDCAGPDEVAMDSLTHLAAASAMLELGQGNTLAALRQARAVFSLGELLFQSPDTIRYLIAMTIESSAMNLDQAIATSSRISVPQLQALGRYLSHLPPIPLLTGPLNDARYDVLNELEQANRFGPATFFDGHHPTPLRTLQAMFLPIDYAGLMHDTNQLFDAEIAAVHARPFPAQITRLAAAEARFSAYSGNDKIQLTGTISEPRLGITGGSAWSRWSNTLLRPLAVFISSQRPRATDIAMLRETALTVRQLTVVTVALALYRKEHGQFPVELSALVPIYLPALPNNLFTRQPLNYRTNAHQHGFLLYSLRPDVVRRHINMHDIHALRIKVTGGNWSAAGARKS